MSQLSDLKGKVAIVTGGASGIGRGIAQQLIIAGAHVVIADIEQDPLQQTAKEIGAFAVHCDVSNLESVQELAKVVCEKYDTVHIMCNNAGIGPVSRIEDMSIADWQWMINVNLWGVIYGTQVFLPIVLKNTDGGHFVNTASMAGLMTTNKLGPYSVTKYGIAALTESLAQELAADHPNVGATLFCPGPVQTNIGNSTRNRPTGSDQGGLDDFPEEEMTDQFGGEIPWMSPMDAGAIVVDAIRHNKLYAVTHPDMFAGVRARFDAIEQAFR